MSTWVTGDFGFTRLAGSSQEGGPHVGQLRSAADIEALGLPTRVVRAGRNLGGSWQVSGDEDVD